MAKRENVFFSGKGAFFQQLMRGDPEYGNWVVRLHFNPESYNLFMKLKETKGETEGIMNEVKKDEEGYFHFFKRPFVKDFGKGEERLAPPVITDAEGKLWDMDKYIGNGSDITVGCELYTYRNRRTKGRGTAIRMASVRIDNFLPYTRADLSEGEQKQIRGMDEQPKQYWNG